MRSFSLSMKSIAIITAPRRLPAAGKVMCLPRGELERASDQDDYTDHDRNGTRQRRQLHLDRRAGGEEQRRDAEEGSLGSSLGNDAS
jgi:hypothetical protein